MNKITKNINIRIKTIKNKKTYYNYNNLILINNI